MLFRDHKGCLIDIKKLDYVRDRDYYRAILIAKKKELHAQTHNEHRRILNLHHSTFRMHLWKRCSKHNDFAPLEKVLQT